MKSQEISGISGSGNRKFRICLVEALPRFHFIFSPCLHAQHIRIQKFLLGKCQEVVILELCNVKEVSILGKNNFLIKKCYRFSYPHC